MGIEREKNRAGEQAGRLSFGVSLMTAGEVERLRRAGERDLIDGYEMGGGSRGYIVDNGHGRPAAVDLTDPKEGGPLAYDVRPALTPAGDAAREAVPENGFAVLGCDDGRKYLFRCSGGDDRGAFAAFSLARVEMRELPDGVEPTMENVGAAGPLKDLAGRAMELDCFDREGNQLGHYEDISVTYEPDIRVGQELAAEAIPFGIDFGREAPVAVYDAPDAGDAADGMDIADDDEERGL